MDDLVRKQKESGNRSKSEFRSVFDRESGLNKTQNVFDSTAVMDTRQEKTGEKTAGTLFEKSVPTTP